MSTTMMSDRRKCPVPRGPKLDIVLMMTHRLTRKREAGILGKPHSELNVTAFSRIKKHVKIVFQKQGTSSKARQVSNLFSTTSTSLCCYRAIYWPFSCNISVEQDAD